MFGFSLVRSFACLLVCLLACLFICLLFVRLESVIFLAGDFFPGMKNTIPEVFLPWGCVLVGCLTSQQYASVYQGRICSDNFTCFHTEIEVADKTFYLTQSQYTDTGPTSPSADPITPGAWQGSHWSANFQVTGMTRPRRKPDSSNGSSALEADALTTRPARRSSVGIYFPVPPRLTGWRLVCVTSGPSGAAWVPTETPPRWPRWPRQRKISGSNPACAGIFSGSGHTSDSKIGTPVATLPGAWRYKVSAGTGRPGVIIL